jgi:subtilisin family serine protease
MTRRFSPFLVAALLAASSLLPPAVAHAAPQRFIVRGVLSLDTGAIVRTACRLVGCKVLYGIDGALGRVFLVTADTPDPELFMFLLRGVLGIEAVEIDQIVRTEGGQEQEPVPDALNDDEPVDFFGVTTRGGYVRQPAVQILGIAGARKDFGVTGRGVTIAVIDTGVDPNHPLLKGVLLRGYDFTRGADGASELSDVDQSTMAVLDNAKPGRVNQSTMAILDQSTMAVLDGPEYSAFGHGTMVAGVVHLIAPRARILPLKAFRADGSGYASDVLRAIYHAVRDGAKVLNMSFSFSTSSPELKRALDYATGRGVVAVASVGNDSLRVTAYPAGLANVIGVASTTDVDTLSDFSNYGPDAAWVAAPGEAIVTTYPFGSYAAGWGTSFSTPFAAGAAALLAEISSRVNAAEAATAQGNAVWVSPEVSRGRIDINAAIRAWRKRLGLR